MAAIIHYMGERTPQKWARLRVWREGVGSTPSKIVKNLFGPFISDLKPKFLLLTGVLHQSTKCSLYAKLPSEGHGRRQIDCWTRMREDRSPV